MHLKFGLVILSIGLVYSISAKDANRAISVSELKQTVSGAITRFEQTDRSAWGFQVSRYESEEGDVTSSIEHFSPDLSVREQWSLESLNGEVPTPKQSQKFVDKKHEEMAEKGEQNINLSLRELIQVNTLTLESEDLNNLRASFAVNIERLGDDASGKLRGSLILDKQNEFIKEIEIINTETFSPMFSAKITDFKLALTFLKIDDAILPYEQRLNMQGSFAFFTEILEESVDTFSNYRYVKSLTNK